MSTKEVSVRVTLLEDHVIREYSKLMSYTVSQLMELAAVETAHRFAIYRAADAVGRELIWDDRPARGKSNSTKRHLVVTLSRAFFPAIERTAEVLKVSLPVFLVGTTLRHISDQKKQLGDLLPTLARLQLPDQYE